MTDVLKIGRDGYVTASQLNDILAQLDDAIGVALQERDRRIAKLESALDAERRLRMSRHGHRVGRGAR